MRVSKIEILLITLGFIGIGVFLAINAGGPIYSDELIYMDAGLNNLRIPYYLNRYTHIFLQKPFLQLASTPLEGAKIYWSFVLTLTGFLIYWCARALGEINHFIHAALSAILFFSFRFFIDYSGVTIVDFTAMLMVMIFMTIYIYAIRNDFPRPWLTALGFVFFVAFKTKETTLILSFLLIGFGFLYTGRYSFRAFWNNLYDFFIGVLVGVGLFIILNAIFLHDPWFGLSPSSIKAFLNTYASVKLAYLQPVSQGWYTAALTTIWLLPFLLYLISGIKSANRLSPPFRLIWLLPISLVIFLTIMTIWRSYKIDPRFFFPALPILCFLGVQFMSFDMPSERRKRIQFGILLLFILLACVAVNYAIRPLSSHMNQGFDGLLSLIFYPLLLSVLILLAFFIRNYSYKTVLIPVACILSMTIYPIRTNIKYLAVLHQNESIVQNRFLPFSAFANQIDFSRDMRFYISSSLHQEYEMLSTDKNEVTSMYNVYFDSKARNNNFKVSSTPDVISRDLSQDTYTYVLLTIQDWQNLVADAEMLAWFEAHYDVLENHEKNMVLLRQK